MGTVGNTVYAVRSNRGGYWMETAPVEGELTARAQFVDEQKYYKEVELITYTVAAVESSK